MTSFTIPGLRAAGFVGFRPLRSLPPRCPAVPGIGGIYAVALSAGAGAVPDFLETSVGGHFKRKSPTVAVSELIANWVATETLYIGSSNNLCRRLHELAEFGRGKPIGHRGGRYLWQLVDHDRLLVCWRPTANTEDPVDVETTLLGEFHDEHGSLPFANLSWPRRTATAA